MVISGAAGGDERADTRNACTSGERVFLVRALGVGVTWTLGALPVAFGLARCPLAALAHVPCPGCGMTRAAMLLLHGDFASSFRLQPLAVPVALATLAVVAATTWATLRRGAPTELMREPFGRAAAWTFVVVQALAVALWLARALGAFGGPVPV